MPYDARDCELDCRINGCPMLSEIDHLSQGEMTPDKREALDAIAAICTAYKISISLVEEDRQSYTESS